MGQELEERWQQKYKTRGIFFLTFLLGNKVKEKNKQILKNKRTVDAGGRMEGRSINKSVGLELMF